MKKPAWHLTHPYDMPGGWVNTIGDAEQGKWVKPAPWARTFFIIETIDWVDTVGEREAAESGFAFYVQLSAVELDGIPEEERVAALSSCGYLEGQDDESNPAILGWNGKVITSFNNLDAVLAEICHDYGLSAPLFDENGNNVLALLKKARGEGNRLMRDKWAFERQMALPVNKIGSTAREFGCGDITSATNRLLAPPEKPVEFGELHADGSYTVVTRIKQSTMRICPHVIMAPEHYKKDTEMALMQGELPCRCDDAEHRKMMIKEWGYTSKDFKGIPLKSGN